MQENVTNQEITDIDLSKIAALQQKRILAFVNHFVVTNVQFLNSFMKTCEQKLMQFEQKLEKVNAAMVLLESKLSSIPELDIPTHEAAESKNEIESKITEKSEENNNQGNNVDTVDTHNKEDKYSTPAQVTPEYEKFIKMVQVGVPVQAVKLKLSLEGLNPNVLDTILSK